MLLLFSSQVMSDSLQPHGPHASPACQASLSLTISCSLPKFMSNELVMPSNHLILCRPLLLLPSILPSIRQNIIIKGLILPTNVNILYFPSKSFFFLIQIKHLLNVRLWGYKVEWRPRFCSQEWSLVKVINLWMYLIFNQYSDTFDLTIRAIRQVLQWKCT